MWIGIWIIFLGTNLIVDNIVNGDGPIFGGDYVVNM